MNVAFAKPSNFQSLESLSFFGQRAPKKHGHGRRSSKSSGATTGAAAAAAAAAIQVPTDTILGDTFRLHVPEELARLLGQHSRYLRSPIHILKLVVPPLVHAMTLPENDPSSLSLAQFFQGDHTDFPLKITDPLSVQGLCYAVHRMYDELCHIHRALGTDPLPRPLPDPAPVLPPESDVARYLGADDQQGLETRFLQPLRQLTDSCPTPHLLTCALRMYDDDATSFLTTLQNAAVLCESLGHATRWLEWMHAGRHVAPAWCPRTFQEEWTRYLKACRTLLRVHAPGTEKYMHPQHDPPTVAHILHHPQWRAMVTDGFLDGGSSTLQGLDAWQVEVDGCIQRLWTVLQSASPPSMATKATKQAATVDDEEQEK